jgi:Ca2+-binding RTX toxin-like protein
MTVGFDQAVTVNTGSGTPSLLLETGAIDRRAIYVSGSGTRDLTFVYTVQEGDVSADLDYHSTAALVLNGATIRNAAQDDAILTLPAPGGADSIAGQHAILIENAPPHSNPGPVVMPNAEGGLDITITDPAQLTPSLGTSGVDHVYYSGSGTVILPDTIENITLSGNADVQGNELGNLVRRGSGQNILDGMGGDDTLYGDEGNDRMYGGTGNDVVSGGSGQDRVYGGSGRDNVQGGTGNDRVYGDAGRDTVSGGSGNDFVEGGADADRLSGGAGQDRLYGGEGRDMLSGGSGHDWLFGGAGQDTLHGGSGNDRFVFDTQLSQSSNVDVIQDFTASEDRIVLDDAVFSRLGAGSAKGVIIQAELFVAGIRAQGAEDRIIYDRATGSLYYDADGTGSAAQVKFATLSNKAALSADDFLII